MSSRVSPSLECLPLRTSSYSPCHSFKAPRAALPSSPLRNSAMPCRLVYGFAISGSKNTRVQRVKRSCSARCDDYDHEAIMKQIQDYGESGNEIAYTVSDNTQNKELNTGEQFSLTKAELLEPSLLGIKPEPPSWPEREEILRQTFKRKVNSVGIPLSIRMIKKKLQLQKDLKEASDLSCCSVKKAFSSMLFIVQELHNHTLKTRESLCSEDLQGVMANMRREMDASFVWLFQKVFWKTPTLMVYVMVLLANFSVFSMSNNTVTVATPGIDQSEGRKERLTVEEEMLWNSMLEEASTLQKGLGTQVQFVAPVSVQIEGDRYEEYVITELYYKKHLRRTPNNSLLLSNYAQFLFLVVHDLDGAEEYFKRSVLVESPEAEAFFRYADFLWWIRKDLWAAELRYLQALEADPGNTYYSSKYASFIWSTGGQDSTSFPIEELDNLQL